MGCGSIKNLWRGTIKARFTVLVKIPCLVDVILGIRITRYMLKWRPASEVSKNGYGLT